MFSPTRGINTLDLLFTPKQFKCISSVNVIASVASSDHSAVLFKLTVASNSAELDSFLKPHLLPTPNFKKCNLAFAERLLSFIDWHSLFASCISIDDYWNTFKFHCLNVMRLTTLITIPFARRYNIPHFLRRAILKKLLLWHNYRHSPDIDTLNNFKTQSWLLRDLSRRHRLHRKTIILQSNDNTKFWRFCSSFTNSNQASYSLPMIFNIKYIISF